MQNRAGSDAGTAMHCLCIGARLAVHPNSRLRLFCLRCTAVTPIARPCRALFSSALLSLMLGASSNL